jgi:hypothetical protein
VRSKTPRYQNALDCVTYASTIPGYRTTAITALNAKWVKKDEASGEIKRLKDQVFPELPVKKVVCNPRHSLIDRL